MGSNEIAKIIRNILQIYSKDLENIGNNREITRHIMCQNQIRKCKPLKQYTIIQNLPTKQSQDCRKATTEFYQTFKDDLTLMLFKMIQETEGKKHYNTDPIHPVTITLL